MMKTSLNVAILCSASLLALSACKSLPGGDNSALEAAEAAAPAFDGTALSMVEATKKKRATSGAILVKRSHSLALRPT